MPLPTPNLDDRRFQELVDHGKRLVQQKCPEWSDHNVSDPGVTMIEIFAWMTDQLIYRLNQVPDRLFLKFLDLLGYELAPPSAAEADVTFWLSAPQTDTVTINPGVEVSTVRAENKAAIAFTVTEQLDIVPCSLAYLLSTIEEGTYRSHTEELELKGVKCFDEVPKPGDALLIGLSNEVPSCAVTLHFDCSIAEGHGVDPRDPPLAWEASDGEKWVACAVGRDETGGLNRPGDIVLHVPRTHAPSNLEGHQAGWLRCRVEEARPGQPAYGGSPEIKALKVFTSGGTARTVNAEIVTDEVLGTSTGHPGQRFSLKHTPVVSTTERAIVEMIPSPAEREWEEVDDFTDSGPNDFHFRIDTMTGEVVFGPAVREPDGSLTRYGAVPDANAMLRIRSYRTGGGTRGNVAAGEIKRLKSSVPRVAKVVNRQPATGGSDAEDVANASVRGPMLLRGTRAVAARDFEHQAMQASPGEVARVLCLPAGDGADPGAVRVLITPQVESDESGRVRFDQLTPLSDLLLKRIQAHLDSRRVVGVRVLIEPPLYMGLTVEARIQASPRVDPKQLQGAAVKALNEYFHPVSGGPDGTGWPFGRPVHAGEAFWVLQRIKGVLFVEEARLYRSNPMTGQRGEEVERLELEQNALVFSNEHAVEVVFGTGS